MSETAAGDGTATVPPKTGRATPWQLLMNNRLAAVGFYVLIAIVALAILAPVLPIPDPNVTEPANRLQPVLSDGHLLGTDHLGRDILSRILWGTQVSLLVGIAASLIAAVIGSLIGLVAGYAGGRTDNLMMRGVDMLMAFPYILLALAIVAALGPGLLNALYAIAIVNIPFFSRNIRGVTISLRRREFVDAARLAGRSHVGILFTEVLPNVLPVIVITMSTTVGWMILETAGLSFLGLGAQPPQADLGSMLGEGRRLLITAPHVSVIPGVVIFLIVMSINLLGDGVRDVLDPRLKSGALAAPSARTAIDLKTEPEEAPLKPDRVLDVVGLETNFNVGDQKYRAVGGVDFHLKETECLGIVGESGSGKSVTAMSLAGLVPTPPGVIEGGRIMFGDRNLLRVSEDELRGIRGAGIAYVFQDPLSTLHPLFTVGDQIAEAVQTHQPVTRQQAWDRAVELLELVRIPNAAERAKSFPHELSGGMRQRVSIAIALANDATVLVADEPTTALDVTVQAQVLKLMDALRKDKQAAVLFITHDFGVVSEICDRIAVMYAGRIVETGPTQAVLDAPAHPYTRMLIDCVPVMGAPERRLDAIPGLPPPVNDLPPGCHFAERCPRATAECRSGEIGIADLGGERGVRCIHPLEEGAA